MTAALHPLTLHRHRGAAELGQAAGRHAADLLAELLAQQDSVRVMLGAAPSQEATLATLVANSRIDFSRVHAFHMDDYLGLDPGAPQGFANWLADRVVRPTGGRLRLHRMDTSMEPAAAAAAYEQAMGTADFDLVLLGLGQNAHLAFNDPPADFDHPRAAAVVALDQVSRQQQVDEGHFPDLAAVPTHAVTVTIPRLLAARTLIASVPGRAKRRAVTATVHGEPDPLVPGTALKLHPDAHLYVDEEAGADV
ncbi:6-phosphogluconolactonase [Ruania zhangjianzhongii]|uniref:6-phosphogluconolactonase n=1 Tax=Ruania zhangjianzhongii TaxID=2603206 RepID=UPI0011C7B52D|nr:6-phosphogluconolactonase [Ruania zhangjianzhongii]